MWVELPAEDYTDEHQKHDRVARLNMEMYGTRSAALFEVLPGEHLGSLEGVLDVDVVDGILRLIPEGGVGPGTSNTNLG